MPIYLKTTTKHKVNVNTKKIYKKKNNISKFVSNWLNYSEKEKYKNLWIFAMNFNEKKKKKWVDMKQIFCIFVQ